MPTPKRSAEERQASDATTGIYSRLRKFDIRLLRLHGSSKRTSPVHCSLEVHGLRDPCCPIFEALSYTWADSSGDNSLRQPIFLGANYCVLAVTNNCMSALRTFRNEVDRLLWVDSICINQKSQSEREAQVALMPRIYSSASRVLMYLEDNSSTADQAMTALVESDNVPSTNVESPLDMQSLLINNYFTRTWMVQEVSLAKSATVTLGNRTVHWSSFKAAALAPATRSNAGHRKTWIEHGDIGYHGKPTLLEYLHSIRHCRCGDPRDQIYAVLGLTQNEREQLSIDYSISVQQLYMGLALYWISSYEYGFLDAIGLKKSIPSLPSWVPDWT
ncbi:HET-domain-containing protein, partial [Ophiobolus disseminans]